MSTATQLLNVARSQIGYRERANNDNKYGIWYTSVVNNGINWNFEPYCAMGLSWAAARMSDGPAAIGGAWASCRAWAAWARKRGRWYSTPQRGDIVFYDWSGLRRQGKEQHVGILERVRDPYNVQVIEWNTVPGQGNQSDGGGCYRRVRNTVFVVGYFRPFYTAERNVVTLPPHSSGVVPLTVDGLWGPKTTDRLQQALRVSRTNVMDGHTLVAMNRWLGQSPLPSWTTATKTALQHRVGAAADGIIGPDTVRALQRFLNRTEW